MVENTGVANLCRLSRLPSLRVYSYYGKQQHRLPEIAVLVKGVCPVLVQMKMYGSPEALLREFTGKGMIDQL